MSSLPSWLGKFLHPVPSAIVQQGRIFTKQVKERSFSATLTLWFAGFLFYFFGSYA